MQNVFVGISFVIIIFLIVLDQTFRVASGFRGECMTSNVILTEK